MVVLHILQVFSTTIALLEPCSAKLLTVPRHNLSLSSRAYSISASTTWKSLPQNVRDCSSLASFWNHIVTHYFSSAFSALWHLTHMRLDSNLTTALYKSLTYLLTCWKRKLSDFGRIIYLPNAEQRVKICQGTAEMLWCIWCEYKHGGAPLTILPSSVWT